MTEPLNVSKSMAWTVLVFVVGLSFSAGGAWVKLLDHDEKLRTLPTDVAIMKTDLAYIKRFVRRLETQRYGAGGPPPY